MKYKSVVITKKGTPDVLQVIEMHLRRPQAGEMLIRVLATGVGRTDIVMRYGYYPFAPKIPFTPGYEIVGVVEAVGENVNRVDIGDRVAALTVYGGYAEYIFLNEDDLVKVPAALDPAQVAALILNYGTAYQMLHRLAGVKSGDRVLITGASGGVGTALLQLGKLANLTMYGTASEKKQDVLVDHGAIPIDYQSQNFVDVIRESEPNGIDYVFDGVGGMNIQLGFQILRQGGQFFEFGYSGIFQFLIDNLRLQFLNWLPNGKSGDFYGITATYRKDKRSITDDLVTLFSLLKEGIINPIIYQKYPILDAAKANEMLESGEVIGKIVLLTPNLMGMNNGKDRHRPQPMQKG
jgi:NADPH:quinone reductase-like Zn-dependent oxidoreductase